MQEITCQLGSIHSSGEAYQDQAFSIDTTGFIVRLVVDRGDQKAEQRKFGSLAAVEEVRMTCE
jgi:hypothetical protein